MYIYLFLRSFVGFIAFISSISSILTQSLPRLRAESRSSLIYPVGANVRLNCPAYDEGTELLYEWSRGKNEPIDELDPRIKINHKGVLRIKSANVEDSGVYHCKAINGFGYVTANITLQVMPNKDLGNLNSQLDNLHPRDDYQNLLIDSNLDYSYMKTITKQVVRDSPKMVSIRKAVGFSVTMNCNLIRNIKWYKNGRLLRHLPQGSHSNGVVLTLTKVRIQDSGNYTCNGLDQFDRRLNNTFNLIVYDNRKPEFTGFDPINSTVVLGDKAIFHCKVYSELKPYIQWLKSYDSINNVDSDEAIHKGLIRINTTYYKVLKSSQVIDNGNGNYFNNLVIEKTQLNDSGDYICLAANSDYGSFNFTYKSTHLTVVSGIDTNSTSDSIGSNVSFSTIFWIVIAITSTLILALILSLCVLQRRPRLETTSHNMINNNTFKRGEMVLDKDRGFFKYNLKQDSALIQDYNCGQTYTNVCQLSTNSTNISKII